MVAIERKGRTEAILVQDRNCQCNPNHRFKSNPCHQVSVQLINLPHQDQPSQHKPIDIQLQIFPKERLLIPKCHQSAKPPFHPHISLRNNLFPLFRNKCTYNVSFPFLPLAFRLVGFKEGHEFYLFFGAFLCRTY